MFAKVRGEKTGENADTSSLYVTSFEVKVLGDSEAMQWSSFSAQS